jgi:hypothetical protein
MLIFLAMQDAIKDKQCSLWNWGGTWKSQKGVYKFKSRWNTLDHPYYYLIKTYKDKEYFEQIGKEKLVEHYPFFYTVPFNTLSHT